MTSSSPAPSPRTALVSRGARRVGLVLLGAGVGLAGCLTVSPGPPRSFISSTGGAPIQLPRLPFPARAEVEAILREAPEPPPAASSDQEPIGPWTLAGGYATHLGELLATNDPSQPILTALFGDDARVVRSAAMRCVAQEQARVALRFGRFGPRSFTELLRARCGVLGLDLSTRFVSVRVSADEPDARVQAALIERMRQMPGLRAAEEPHEYGAAFLRSQDQALLVSAWSRPLLTIDPGPRAPDEDGMVVISGVAPEGVAAIDANINQGDDQVADCVEDPHVALPNFRLRCPLAAGASATVEVFRRNAGAFLETPLLLVEMGDPARYPTSYAPREPAADGGQGASPRDRVVALVNAARQRVGAPTVTVIPRQSEALCALAPWVVSGLRGRLPARARDALTLTMLAGWEVPEGIAHGGVASSVAPGAEVGSTFEDEFAHPTRRRLLLDRRWNRVAMCPSRDADGRAVGTHWAFFQTYEPDHHDRDVAALQQALVAHRAQSGAPSAPIDEALSAIAAAATRRLTLGEAEAATAMDDAMRATLARFNENLAPGQRVGVSAWWVMVPADRPLDLSSLRMNATQRAFGVAMAYVPFLESRWVARFGLVLALTGSAPTPPEATP